MATKARNVQTYELLHLRGDDPPTQPPTHLLTPHTPTPHHLLYPHTPY